MRCRVLLTVACQQLLLHRLCKSSNRVTRFLLTRRAAHADVVSGDLHGALGACEDESFALIASIHEIDPQVQIEALAIVEESEQHVIGVTAIFPEPQSSRGHRTSGAVATGDEMRSAEEMDEKISGDTASVGLPLSPLEKVFAH